MTPKFNKFISRMKQIWELWYLLRKPWGSSGFDRVCSEKLWICHIYKYSSQPSALCWDPVRCHSYRMDERHLRNVIEHKIWLELLYFPYDWKKKYWEEWSVAIAWILLPLPLKCSLISGSKRFNGTTKVSQRVLSLKT